MKESNNMTNAIEVIIYNSRVRGVPFFFFYQTVYGRKRLLTETVVLQGPSNQCVILNQS